MVTGSMESEERCDSSSLDAHRRTSGSDGAYGVTLDPKVRELTQIVGLALSDMGVVDPDASLLEPVARAIHSLGASGQSEGPRCEPS